MILGLHVTIRDYRCASVVWNEWKCTDIGAIRQVCGRSLSVAMISRDIAILEIFTFRGNSPLRSDK
jgi:hypothetical protein